MKFPDDPYAPAASLARSAAMPARITAAAPPRRRWRSAITDLHRWFGLFAALWLFGIALSGSLIAFDHELDGWLNPDLFATSGEGPLAPLLADAQARAGAGRIQYVVKTTDESGLVTMGIENGRGERSELFYDSGSGKLNGMRDADRNGLDARAFMPTVYRLHYSFLGGETLQIFLGLVALGWAITQLLALAIAFTSSARWRDSFRVRAGARGHKRNFDLHRALALWLYPVTLVLAVSGVYLNLPDPFTAAVGSVAQTDGRFDPPAATAPDVRLSMAAAAARFDAIAAPHKVTSFSLNADAGLYRARMRDARDISDNGQRIVWISAQDGRIVSDRHETQGPAGDQFIAWQFPLHSGRALGLPGRMLISFTGLVICTSIVTGLLIWWKKRQQRRRVHRA